MREVYVEPCLVRSEYQRDRDRIIHSKAFRRLMHKTQVFLAPKGDHYRTRLTHTLEVSQIARTITRACGLNEDLTEAIALGHDLGHTPFGHTGEDALNKKCSFGFRHNNQSLRIVQKLENGGKGLNLCLDTCDGILCHSGNAKAKTFEGQIVNISDRIAYINHDIDDAIRAKVLSISDIPSDLLEILGKTHSQRINTLVVEMINFYKKNNQISMDKEIYDAMLALRTFMFDNVYLDPYVKAEEDKAKHVIYALFDYYKQNPEKIPVEYNDDNIERNICDYIAGMTDRYAVNLYQELFVPKGFSVY